MTLDELDRLHAESERNSPSPWTVDHARRVRDADRCLTHGVDSLSIVALHNAWPEVSARLRAAEAEVERLRGALRAMVDTYPTAALVTPSRFSNAVDAARAALQRARDDVAAVVDDDESNCGGGMSSVLTAKRWRRASA